MKLTELIDELGPTKLGKLLKCSPARVTNWKLGTAGPSPKIMVEIVKVTKGKVSYKDIMEEFYGKNSIKKLPKKP